ncbi:MAG TPA: zinc ribbon domain-containing protein, partial [Pyrinomonadaceae bacterium]
MSLPEISRRCLACGAAVRAGSRFCPQCGNALEAEATPAAGPEAGSARASVPATGDGSPREQPAAPPDKEWAPPTREFAAFEQSAG